MYFALFDEQGNRITSYHPDIHDKIPPHAIQISDDDQALYATNGYIRGADGSPVKRPPYVPTLHEIQKQLTDAVQDYMDSVAQSKGYDNIFTAVTYAEEPTIPKFQAEGQAFRQWRSQVWDYCYAQLDKVLKGERTVPTAEELIAELPELVLPE